MTENIVSQTTVTFVLLHRTDEPVTTIEEALERATIGHAVGSIAPTIVTAPVANAKVPELLRELGNDGAFFEDDIAEADEDADNDNDNGDIDFSVTADSTVLTDGWEDRSTLAGGFSQALAHIKAPQHPDLVLIAARMRECTALTHHTSTLEDLLGVYDELTTYLSAFSERARQAITERDSLDARGELDETNDPYASYGGDDWGNADRACAALNRARMQATGRLTPGTTFSMYTDAGNAAVFTAMDTLAVTIDSAGLSPEKMLETIKDTVKQVATQHPEVHDTEPEWDIVDALNPLLRRRGYAEISRDALF